MSVRMKRVVDGIKYSQKIYDAWKNMILRCESPNCAAYHVYGGRGICVCAEWHSFAAFAKDMGEPPTQKHSLDRINPLGNYEPSNCRWATAAQQTENRALAIARKVITFEKLAADLGIECSHASKIMRGEAGGITFRRKTVEFFVNRINSLISQGWRITPYRILAVERAAAECGIKTPINLTPHAPTQPPA